MPLPGSISGLWLRMNIITFSASVTYTPTPGMVKNDVYLYAGGGAGGAGRLSRRLRLPLARAAEVEGVSCLGLSPHRRSVRRRR